MVSGVQVVGYVAFAPPCHLDRGAQIFVAFAFESYDVGYNEKNH